ncbi:MAG: twin-arginine translocase subunit TatC [Dehalococcoidales bacterium]
MDLDRKLPVRSHLAEVRKRLLSCMLAVLVTTAISAVFAKYIFRILESRAENINLIYIEMTEMLGTYFRVAFMSGIVLASPFLIYQFVMFIRPGLNTTERRYLYFLLPSAMLAFAAGVAFGYFVLFPPMARFLITFGSDIATPQIRVGNFVSLMVRLLFSLGLCFETPLLAFFLAKIGVVTPQMLSRYRKFAVVGAFILGAIITPTFDPINQSIVAIPLILLYELGILLAKLARRKEKRRT